MHKKHDCNNCIKLVVCSKLEDYNNKCLELTDTNTDDYVSYLECKHYEERVKK